MQTFIYKLSELCMLMQSMKVTRAFPSGLREKYINTVASFSVINMYVCTVNGCMQINKVIGVNDGQDI